MYKFKGWYRRVESRKFCIAPLLKFLWDFLLLQNRFYIQFIVLNVGLLKIFHLKGFTVLHLFFFSFQFFLYKISFPQKIGKNYKFKIKLYKKKRKLKYRFNAHGYKSIEFTYKTLFIQEIFFQKSCISILFIFVAFSFITQLGELWTNRKHF